VELPRKVRQTVKLGDLPIEDYHPLVFPVGMNVDGEVISANLAEMPHILVSGTTGAGKSCFINAMLVSMINRAGPDRLKLSLIDPKMVELTPFDGIPHLLGPVVTDPEEAHSTLFWLTEEMDRRYQAMRSAKVRSIETLDMPYIVVVIDELADLMKSRMGSDIEETIVRLAQKARAAGIHLVLATQRPSVDVVTGLIKANVPSRLAFSMASGVDSRVVLDQNGAESLLGKGDGLFLPVGNRHPIRIQSPFVTDEEVDTAVQEVS
jgi:S-DNA-T family DNA segregation ATPase FtsK/SpoIIIE